MKKRILIVDNEECIRFTFGNFLQAAGFDTLEAGTYEEAVCLWEQSGFDLAIVDIVLNGKTGIDLLRHIRKAGSDTPVILITEAPSVGTAAMAVRLGAADYIVKPVLKDTLLEVTDTALRRKSAVEKASPGGAITFREKEKHNRKDCNGIVGHSPAIRQVCAMIRKLAPVPSHVLITGESGTGKELVADAIHALGKRRDKPLVKVNCAALSENLLESELFGHVRGAFTGAVTNRIGRFQKADGGTLFLDEIGEIDPRVQLRFLRVLEQMEIERVGETDPVKVDVRIIAATNLDLRQQVALGRFREDLYYRLKVVEIRIPPLRARREDIPLLVRFFVDRYNCLFGRDIETVSPGVIDYFMRCDWPGNIRELKNIMEYAFVVCKGNEITFGDLPGDFELSYPPLAPRAGGCQCITDIETALRQSAGNKSLAARLLGISRRTLYRKIDRFNHLPKN